MADNNDDDTIQTKLREILARGRSDQHTLIAALSVEEQSAVGDPDRWSLKDHLAHLNFWRQDALEHMSAAEHAEEVPGHPYPDEKVQQLNAQTFAEHRLTPWDAIVAESERLYSAAADQIDRLSPSQLTAAHIGLGGEERMLFEVMLGSFYLHPADHYAQLYRERGDIGRADRQRVASVETVGDLFGVSSEVYGNELYNLGCYWALTGRPERAIDAVGRAFTLNPVLVAWSRQDSDLDSLRDVPAFQALYT